MQLYDNIEIANYEEIIKCFYVDGTDEHENSKIIDVAIINLDNYIAYIEQLGGIESVKVVKECGVNNDNNRVILNYIVTHNDGSEDVLEVLCVKLDNRWHINFIDFLN